MNVQPSRKLRHSVRLPHRLYLPFLALATEIILSRSLWPEYAVFLIEYGLLFWFVLCNPGPGRRLQNSAKSTFMSIPGSWPWWIGTGTLLNFLVIAVNDFRMPVSSSLLMAPANQTFLEKLLEGEFFGYVIAGPETKLSFLGDTIGVSPFGQLMGFASIGDILLLIGGLLLVLWILKQ